MENELSGWDLAKIDLEALRQTKETFRHVAENIREVLFVITPTPPRMVYVSPAYETVFGKFRDELYERANAWTDAVDPQDRSHVLSVFEQSMQGVATDVEYRLIRPDGSIRWVHARNFPIHDSTGKLVRVVGIAEDISDSQRATEEIVAARQAVAVTKQAKTEFLTNMDYEIRTAMNGIVGMTDLLLSTNMNSEQVEYVQMVKTSADLLLKAILDLRKFIS